MGQNYSSEVADSNFASQLEAVFLHETLIRTIGIKCYFRYRDDIFGIFSKPRNFALMQVTVERWASRVSSIYNLEQWEHSA